MATMNELLQLALASKKPNPNFTTEEVSESFRKALMEYTGLTENSSLRDIMSNRSIFAVVEEIVDQMVPKLLEEQIGAFAEIKQLARDAQPVFKVKNVNRNRVALGISGASRGGIYKARRLDTREMEVSVKADGVAYMVTMEDLILGKSTIGDLVEIITKGFVDKIFIEVISRIRGLYSALLPNNKVTVTNDSAAIGVGLDAILKTAKMYGNPMILAFDDVASKILTIVGDSTVITQNVSQMDIESIRATGYVSNYKGNVPLVVLPNYFLDETNDMKYFKENDAWVLPISEKPIKVVLVGETLTREVPQAAGGVEYHAERLMGVGVLFANQVCMLRVGGSETATDANGMW